MGAPGGHESCSGCDLCLLACPVWHATRDVRLTPHGRAKALQGGATAADIAPALEACTLCGSCEPACPESIPLTGLVRKLRGEIHFNVIVEKPVRPAQVAALAGTAYVLADDDVIANALEDGSAIDPARLEAFLAPLRRAKTVVASGLLFGALRGWLPRVKVRTPGETLSALPAVRRNLRRDDIYVIEPRAFHADHARLVRYYDAMRHTLGCSMNLDLQRLAIATTANSLPSRAGTGVVDPRAQARWILEGRDFSRVVVEDLADKAVFEAVTDTPVVCVADLA